MPPAMRRTGGEKGEKSQHLHYKYEKGIETNQKGKERM